MKTKLPIICLVLLSQILLTSCSTKLDSPNINIDSNYTNQQIQAQLFPAQNTFETVNPVILLIQSFSGNKIVFPKNFNVRIFQQKDNQWVEIKEKPVDRLPKMMLFFHQKQGLEKYLQFFLIKGLHS